MDSTELTFEELKQQYNKIPVAYCGRCLSLRIRFTFEGDDYCDNCGDTNIKYLMIDEWKEVFKEKYGEEFVKEQKDGE